MTGTTDTGSEATENVVIHTGNHVSGLFILNTKMC